MRRFLESEYFERALFTALVIGVLMAGFAAVQYAGLANQLAGNMAAQIHEEGGEVELESKSQAPVLMASDMERRRLQAEQSNMMMVGGVGLALIGLAWIARDFARGRRRETPRPPNESNVSLS